MRLYLDETLPTRIAEIGRGLGLDLISPHGVGRDGLAAEDQLRAADHLTFEDLTMSELQLMTTTYVALLRAVNVGGHGKVAMSDLRDCLAQLGFADVRSLLQTGNLVFRAESKAGLEYERLLESEAARRLDLRTDVLIRTADEWSAIVDGNPFPEVAQRDPGHLVVVFLKQAPEQKSVDALRAAVSGREIVAVENNQAYITYPDGIGRSRLTHALVESRLGTRGTGRNWNTVLKLAALVQA